MVARKRSFPDKRTPEEARDELVADRNKRLGACMLLLCALHDAGFRSLWVESSQIGRQDYYAFIVVDETAIEGDRFEQLVSVVNRNGGSITLSEVRMNGQEFSRLRVWPHVG
jgi:hypothetical protein